jgi:RNA polymerase sigma-70 factor (ECF subfamily)
MDLPQFYDEYVDKVYKFFYIKNLNKQIAEDLTSQTFTLFVEQLSNQDIQDYKKYLYGIMRNIWLQFLREKYRESLEYVESIDDFETYSEMDIYDFDSSENPENRMRPFVEKLPKKQQQVLKMRIYENMSTGEVAKQLGRDKNYVKTTYQRALKSLREMLETPYIYIMEEQK